MWLIFFIISVLCIFVGALLPVVTGATSKKNKAFFYCLFAGVWFSGFFNFFPMHYDAAGEGISAAARAFFLSVYNATQVFTIGTEYQVITEGLVNCEGWLHTAYSVWSAVLFVIAPIFTFGFVLSLFKNITEKLKLIIAYNKDIYIFSELNEGSLALAEDIKKHSPQAVIAFTDVFEESEEKMYEFAEKARTLGAICFKKDLLAVDFTHHSKKSNMYFFMIDENENENLNQAIQVIGKYKNRKNTQLYVFSTKTESELLLTAVHKGEVKVRRINHIQALISRVLYEEGKFLFEDALEAEDGVRDISAVIVGMGRHGTEMMKALAWYCQMDGYRISIDGFDIRKNSADKLRAESPELLDEKYNGVVTEGEAQYRITLHPGCNVEGYSFYEEICKLKKATYVLVALGNDDRNINAAVRLRMWFERIGAKPRIQTIVYDDKQGKALTGVVNYRGKPYDIEFIGGLRSSYTRDVIMGTELEQEALKRHLKWGNEEEFWAYEYNYRSSTASAIHRRARIACGIAGAEKAESELTDAEKDVIGLLEHKRWNAYMRAEGYVYTGSRDPKTRNDLAKTHHDLVPYGMLSQSDKDKDSSVGTE